MPPELIGLLSEAPGLAVALYALLLIKKTRAEVRDLRARVEQLNGD